MGSKGALGIFLRSKAKNESLKYVTMVGVEHTGCYGHTFDAFKVNMGTVMLLLR